MQDRVVVVGLSPWCMYGSDLQVMFFVQLFLVAASGIRFEISPISYPCSHFSLSLSRKCLSHIKQRTYLYSSRVFILFHTYVVVCISCHSTMCVFFPFTLDVELPGSRRRKLTQDFSPNFLLRCMPLFFL